MCHECQLVWQMMTLELFLFFIIQAVKDSSTAEVNSVALDARRRDTNLIKNVNQSIRSCNRNFMSFFFSSCFFFSANWQDTVQTVLLSALLSQFGINLSHFYLPLETIDQLDYILNQWNITSYFFSRFSNYWAKGQYVDRILFKGFFTFLRL